MFRTVLFVCMAALFSIALYPGRVTTAPEWQVYVVDEGGKPLQGIHVQVVWQHYSVERRASEEERATDRIGYVLFPKRTIRASFVARIIGVVYNLASGGVHASFGPYAYLDVRFPAGYGNNDAREFAQNEARWRAGPGKVVSRLILHRCKNRATGIVCMS